MGVIICVECRKPRLYYSRIRLSGRQEQLLVIAISEYDYTCGGPIAHPSVALLKSVFAREKLTCGYPVETPYYSSIFANVDVCAFCASDGGNIDTEMKKNTRLCFPYARLLEEVEKWPLFKDHMAKMQKRNLTCAVLRLKLFNLVTFVPLYYQNHTI